MFDVLKSVNWLNLVLYGVFGALLSIGGIGVLTQPGLFLVLLGILIAVDINSHIKGLNKGIEITRDVWSIK